MMASSRTTSEPLVIMGVDAKPVDFAELAKRVNPLLENGVDLVILQLVAELVANKKEKASLKKVKICDRTFDQDEVVVVGQRYDTAGIRREVLKQLDIIKNN